MKSQEPWSNPVACSWILKVEYSWLLDALLRELIYVASIVSARWLHIESPFPWSSSFFSFYAWESQSWKVWGSPFLSPGSSWSGDSVNLREDNWSSIRVSKRHLLVVCFCRLGSMGFELNSSMKKASNVQPLTYLRLRRNKVSSTNGVIPSTVLSGRGQGSGLCCLSVQHDCVWVAGFLSISIKFLQNKKLPKRAGREKG